MKPPKPRHPLDSDAQALQLLAFQYPQNGACDWLQLFHDTGEQFEMS